MRRLGKTMMAILLLCQCAVAEQPRGEFENGILDDYRVQIGDKLSISITGSIHFTYIEVVSLQGTILIQIPSEESGIVEDAGEQTIVGWLSIETIPVLGLTINELMVLLQSRFSNYYKGIEVFVSLTQSGKRIYVSGAVMSPGSFPFLPGRTVEDYIGLAGGVSVEGSISHTQVIRSDGSVLEANEVFFLKPGDTVLVPEKYVYVQGAVNDPGAVPFRAGRTIEDYIGLAGGPTDRAHVKKVHLIRSNGSDEKIPGETTVKFGDIIVMPELTLKWPDDYLTVFGFISSTFVTWYLLARN